MKKIIAMMLVLCFILTGCGKTDKDTDNEVENEGNTNNIEENVNEEKEENEEKVPFEEIVVFDNDEYEVVINSFEEQAMGNKAGWGSIDRTFNIHIENKSKKEKNYYVNVINGYINGVKVDFLCEGYAVGPGASGDAPLRFRDLDLDYVIGEATDIQFDVFVLGGDDAMKMIKYHMRKIDSIDGYSDEDSQIKTVNYYPMGEEKASKHKFDEEEYPQSKVIFDKEGVKVTLLEYEITDKNSIEAYMFVENNTEYKINYRVSKCTVDGKEVVAGVNNLSNGDSIDKGMSNYWKVDVYNYNMESAGVTNINDINFEISISKLDTLFNIKTGETEMMKETAKID